MGFKAYNVMIMLIDTSHGIFAHFFLRIICVNPMRNDNLSFSTTNWGLRLILRCTYLICAYWIVIVKHNNVIYFCVYIARLFSHKYLYIYTHTHTYTHTDAKLHFQSDEITKLVHIRLKLLLIGQWISMYTYAVF